MSEMDQGNTVAPDHRSVTPHTQLPWVTCKNGQNGNPAYIFRELGECIADCEFSLNDRVNEANSAFIVRAVNSHYALVEALEAAQVFAESVLEMHGPDHAGLNLSTLNKIDRALSAAKGET